MAQVLTTKASTAALEDIIRNAREELFLISYSFRIGKTFLRHIRNAVEKGVRVKIVYGKFIFDNITTDLAQIAGLEVYYCSDLHAKVYCNDCKCIVGSMNFYEKSDNENIELGVLLTNTEDPEAYSEAMRACREIYKEAAHAGIKAKPSKERFPQGYCIRTGKRIPLNHEKPLCEEAFQVWVQYGRGDYQENFCHFTGESGETCYDYPVLSKNWNAYVSEISKELKNV